LDDSLGPEEDESMFRMSVKVEGEPETVGNDTHWLWAIYGSLPEEQQRKVREKVRELWSKRDFLED
jgi:hypothetical protein